MSQDPPKDHDKWTFEFWEHNEGVSRASKEYSKLKDKDKKSFVDIGEKLDKYLENEVEILIKIRKIKEVKNNKGLFEVRFLLGSANGRFMGTFTDLTVQYPIFYALSFFIKKTDDIPKDELLTAQNRLKEFNQTKI